MSLARSAHNTLLQIGDGATPSENFVTVAEVKDIGGPGLAAATEDVTSHDSAGWREHIVTIKEGGEVTFDVNFIGDSTQGPDGGLWEDFVEGNLRNFQILFDTANNDQVDFGAYVTGYEMGAPVEGVLNAAITLTISGAVEWDNWVV